MIVQALYMVCCIYLILKLWRNKFKEAALTPPFFSGGYPIIGHLLKLMGDRKHVFNIIKSMSRETLENGGIISLNVGSRILYVISDPDDCATVANECLDKDYYYSFAKPFLGNGLTIADVSIWRQHRKLMSPAFRLQNLNGLLVVFNRQARRLVSQFAEELGRGLFNLEKYVRLNSLESICMTSFGADVSDLSESHQQYLEAVDEVLDIFTERFQKFWLHSEFMYDWSNLKKKQDSCMEKIKSFSSAVLAKRKSEIKGVGDSADESGQFIPFMSFLVEISKNTEYYSEEDILYETNTIVGAGYDTSVIAITLTLMLIGSNPKVQKKVYEELQEVFENSYRDVSKEDLIKLIYLDAVIKETLRVYPVAPLVARQLVKDIKIKNYTLKAGNGVGVLLWAMHRHTIWGTDADVFRPERWLDGSLPSNPNAFGGFSLGKRACIGKTYAMMSIKTVLSHVLRRYQITSDISKLELEMHGSLRIASGQNITIEDRNICL